MKKVFVLLFLGVSLFSYGQKWTREHIKADAMAGNPEGERYTWQHGDTIVTIWSYGYDLKITDGHTRFLPDSRDNYIRVPGRRYGSDQRTMVLPSDVGAIGAQNVEGLADFGFYDAQGNLVKHDKDSRIELTDSCKIIRLPISPKLKVKKGAFRFAEWLRSGQGYARIRIVKMDGEYFDLSIPCLKKF